jgi:hypothetical protein
MLKAVDVVHVIVCEYEKPSQPVTDVKTFLDTNVAELARKLKARSRVQ